MCASYCRSNAPLTLWMASRKMTVSGTPRAQSDSELYA